LTDITGKQVLKKYFDRPSLMNGSQNTKYGAFSNGICLLYIGSGGRSVTKKADHPACTA
jgi:hypothetical protein